MQLRRVKKSVTKYEFYTCFRKVFFGKTAFSVYFFYNATHLCPAGQQQFGPWQFNAERADRTYSSA
jgi:hypothetical protein